MIEFFGKDKQTPNLRPYGRPTQRIPFGEWYMGTLFFLITFAP
jgi:hypothetical protein